MLIVLSLLNSRLLVNGIDKTVLSEFSSLLGGTWWIVVPPRNNAASPSSKYIVFISLFSVLHSNGLISPFFLIHKIKLYISGLFNGSTCHKCCESFPWYLYIVVFYNTLILNV